MAADSIRISVPFSCHSELRARLPRTGNRLLASLVDVNGERGVLVYQAFNPEIAEYAIQHGRFDGCPAYLNRMTWIKPQFSWMMFRSEWGTARNQEKIIGLVLRESFWQEILTDAVASSYPKSAPESLTREIWKAAVKNGSIHPEYGQGWVRLQWDPDHSPRPPYGHYQRRAIQLGLRGGFQKRLADGSGVLAILDVSPIVELQRKVLRLVSADDPASGDGCGVAAPAKSATNGASTTDGASTTATTSTTEASKGSVDVGFQYESHRGWRPDLASLEALGEVVAVAQDVYRPEEVTVTATQPSVWLQADSDEEAEAVGGGAR